jgi:hypothetical protein
MGEGSGRPNARCETGRLQARGQFQFKGGTFLSGTFIRPCKGAELILMQRVPLRTAVAHFFIFSCPLPEAMCAAGERRDNWCEDAGRFP